MLNIALFGPPGAGKGTQAQRIVEKYHLTHLSTGEMIRKEISQATELGKLAQEVINSGQLLSDELVVKMIASCISESKDGAGFLFDGFPRTVAQAEMLDKMLAEIGSPLNALISIEVPFEELKARMLKRAEIEGRADDNEEAIEQRFKEYNAKTVHVAGYYKEQSKLQTINGSGTFDEVFANIQNVLGKLK